MKEIKKYNYYIYEMNLKTLTIVSFVFLILAFIPCFWMNVSISNKDMMTACLFMIPWLLLHELLHSISYLLCGAKFQSITYGMALEKSILYCLCKQNISKKNILCSLLAPFIMIGIITYLIGIVIESPVLILLSILNISGCSGDIIMFLFISRLKEIEFSEFDNPVAFGIYTKEKIKTNPFGLTFIEKKEKLERNDFKKIRISKASIWILLGLGLLFLLSVLLNCI